MFLIYIPVVWFLMLFVDACLWEREVRGVFVENIKGAGAPC